MTENYSERSSYPSNSNKDKAQKRERPKQEPVVRAEVKRRPKPLSRKLAETFTADDTGSVGQYVLLEVLIPAAKNMISDAVSQGIERLLFGDSARPTSGARKGNYTAYNRLSKSTQSPSRNLSPQARATHNFDEVVLSDRAEADEVLDRLYDLIANYQVATVADLYDLIGQTGSFTDDKWGWSSLQGAGVRRIRNGYLIDLPKTEPID